MLMMNEKEGLPVKSEWFNHLPIYHEKELPMDFKEHDFPVCTNYPNLQVEPRELDAFKTHPFTNTLSQEVVKFDENVLSDCLSFDSFFENEKVEDSIGKTNKINPYSLLVDAFKEMINHMEGHCSL